MHSTFVFFILLPLMLGGCTYNIRNHGTTEMDLISWNKIKVGDKREEVFKVLGSPTLISKFDENTWYYISYKIKQFNLLGKRKYSSRSLQILFDKNDLILDIKKIFTPYQTIIVNTKKKN